MGPAVEGPCNDMLLNWWWRSSLGKNILSDDRGITEFAFVPVKACFSRLNLKASSARLKRRTLKQITPIFPSRPFFGFFTWPVFGSSFFESRFCETETIARSLHLFLVVSRGLCRIKRVG